MGKNQASTNLVCHSIGTEAELRRAQYSSQPGLGGSCPTHAMALPACCVQLCFLSFFLKMGSYIGEANIYFSSSELLLDLVSLFKRISSSS